MVTLKVYKLNTVSEKRSKMRIKPFADIMGGGLKLETKPKNGLKNLENLTTD